MDAAVSRIDDASHLSRRREDIMDLPLYDLTYTLDRPFDTRVSRRVDDGPLVVTAAQPPAGMPVVQRLEAGMTDCACVLRPDPEGARPYSVVVRGGVHIAISIFNPVDGERAPAWLYPIGLAARPGARGAAADAIFPRFRLSDPSSPLLQLGEDEDPANPHSYDFLVVFRDALGRTGMLDPMMRKAAQPARRAAPRAVYA